MSNVREIARAFLPTGARVIPISTEIADYKLAGNSADARLQDLPWPPDLVWLGMGEDGHTASIFAGPDMQDALDAPKARRAVGVMPDPMPKEAPVARVTLTRAAILSARTVLITITGQEKRELLEQAIADGQSSKLPIGRVLAEAEQPIDIHWAPELDLLEAPAGGFLEEQQRDDDRDGGEHDRVPQALVDVAGDGDERETRDRQEAADPAGADMVGE